jgi:hypothetical protein
VTREELEHAIRAACDVAGDSAVYVFGSQAILGQFPDAPPDLRQSVEVDVSPRTHVGRVDAIDGNLGELSRFHREFGFYVHGLAIEAAKLPKGWKQRVVPVTQTVGSREAVGLCIEVHDIAASKLAAFRDKDRDYVRVLMANRLVNPATLKKRIETLGLVTAERERRVLWVELTAKALRE